CNGLETCDANAFCHPGTLPVLSDGDPCTVDSCNPSGGIAHRAVANGTSCSDGNPCNGVETCFAGACTPHVPTLTDNNSCTDDVCDPVYGIRHTPRAAGTSCAAANPCNGQEFCDGAGTCQAGSTTAVSDGNPCTIDA